MSALKRAVDDVMQHQWSHSREAMSALQRLIDAADEAEDVIEVLAENRRADGRPQWAGVGKWLQPGESIVVLRAGDPPPCQRFDSAVELEALGDMVAESMAGADGSRTDGGGRF